MKTITIAAFALSLTLLCGGPLLAQSGSDLYQQALVKERAEGNVQGAIELYQRIVTEFADDRPLAAKALVQMGLCYEKLGLTEARQVYQQVIDGFPEQQGEVAVARERLALLAQALAELETGPTFRKIEIASKPQNGVLSPDGNELAFIADGAVWIVPVHGEVDPNIAGEPVRLVDVPGVWDVGNLLAWSANGEWIAVNSEANDEETAYVIPAAGGEPRVVPLPDRGGTHAYHNRLSLSPDGQQVAYSGRDWDTPEDAPNSHHLFIYSMSTAGSEVQRVTTVRGEMPAYSPDGEFIAFRSPRGKRDWPEDTERGQDEAIYDADLWVVPSAGGAAVRLDAVRGRLRGPVWSPDGRFIAAHHEPGPNNLSQEAWVYPLSPDASSAGEPTKISLPRPALNSLAGWTPDGELGVFLASEMHEAVYTVPASGGRAVQVTPDGYYYYTRWSPDGERIYLIVGGGGMGYVRSAGGDPVAMPVPPEGRPTSRVPGGGHNLSPDGERIVISSGGGGIWTIPVGGGRPLRVTTKEESWERYPCWSPDGEWIAFVDWHGTLEEDGFDAIYVVPSEGGDARQITSETDSVGPGAIAFAPNGERIAFFSGDAIKTMPVEGGQSEVLVSEARHSRHTQLAYSPDGSRIAHNAGGKIWITPLQGGRPEELRTSLPPGAELTEFGWSPDGEKIVFVASVGGDYEFWLISDFLPSNVGG